MMPKVTKGETSAAETKKKTTAAKAAGKKSKEPQDGIIAESDRPEDQANLQGEEVTKEDSDGNLRGPAQESDQGAAASDSPREEEVAAADAEEPALAKAGKRSAKALQEAEAKQAKAARKAKAADEAAEDKPKVTQKPPRSRLERRSKKYRQAAEKFDRSKAYPLAEALELAVASSPVKFDATVELHIRLRVDPRQADQNIRDTIVLPAGTGKTVRVAVLADGEDLDKAKKAGADTVAGNEFLQALDKGEINFDILVSTPAMMPKLGKYARLLGPKGLMPNPKSGTVTTDVAKAVSEAKAGRVEYRVDSTGIVHLGIGKASFGKDKLLQNAEAVLGNIRANKPASVKGNFVISVFTTTTMGPSIQINT